MSNYSELSDKQLLDLMTRDNKLAFNALYLRYWNKVLYLAVQKLKDMMEAENVVQDVFFSIWQRRNELEITGQIEHYLVVAVKYRVIKLLNKQRIQRLYEENTVLAFDLLDDSTQEYLAFDELKGRLEMAIIGLPEKSRLIYRLNQDEHMSYKQIAETLGTTEKAVDSHMVRTRKSLRASLANFLAVYLF